MSREGKSGAAERSMLWRSITVTDEVERSSVVSRRSGVVMTIRSSIVALPAGSWAPAWLVETSATAPVKKTVFFNSAPKRIDGATAPQGSFRTAGGRGEGRFAGSRISPSGRSGMRQHFTCHRHGRPRLTTPRGQAWVTGTGRSPDFRVIALFRLPGRMQRSVASWKKAQRLQLRGQSRLWPIVRPHRVPFSSALRRNQLQIRS